jgi:hypothetical protein
MKHLAPEQLVDLADGTLPATSAPHLEKCPACRGAVSDMRALMSDLRPSAVPEPSPLFWDRLSRQVREAVAAEPAPQGGWFGGALALPRFALPLSVAAATAAIVLVGSLTLRVGAPHVAPTSPAVDTLPPLATSLYGDPVILENDVSLDLVAERNAGVDWMTTGQDWTAHAGDDAAAGLTAAELAQLRRVMKNEFGL